MRRCASRALPDSSKPAPANRKRFHLPDGEAQRARDEAMATSGDRSIANIGWLYAYDAAEVR
jgi:hypothetical protein